MTCDSPRNATLGDAPRSRLVKLLIQIGLIATCPFLGLSVLLLAGLPMSLAFITEFTVENRTDETIVVTPIGTVGEPGNRRILPIFIYGWPFLPVWSSQPAGFEIPPGESIDIIYDMEDINFSEIVVHDDDGELGQLVVNPNPTQKQYHAPAHRRFAIDDLDSLVAVPGPVRDAVRDAQNPLDGTWIIVGVIVGPWLLWALLLVLDGSWGKPDARTFKYAAWIILGVFLGPFLVLIPAYLYYRSRRKSNSMRQPIASGT